MSLNGSRGMGVDYLSNIPVHGETLSGYQQVVCLLVDTVLTRYQSVTFGAAHVAPAATLKENIGLVT